MVSIKFIGNLKQLYTKTLKNKAILSLRWQYTKHAHTINQDVLTSQFQ